MDPDQLMKPSDLDLHCWQKRTYFEKVMHPMCLLEYCVFLFFFFFFFFFFFSFFFFFEGEGEALNLFLKSFSFFLI